MNRDIKINDSPIVLFLLLTVFLLINLTQFSFANVAFVSYNQSLNLTNTTILSAGQQNLFLNGTIKVSSIQTTYTPSDVGNIHSLNKTNWTATTYVDLFSTYEQPLFIGTTFFRALNTNPSNVSAYEWITTKQVVNVITSIQIVPTRVSTTNGIIIENVRHTTMTPEVQIGGYWQPLSNNNTILAAGDNQFKIMGDGKSGNTYNWTYEFSTANIVTPSAITSNLIIGNTTITPQSIMNYNSTEISHLPITTINIDPFWTIPSGIQEWFNLTVTNQDPNNAIYVGNAIGYSFNALQYGPYANNAFTNWVIFNGYTGNILYSWLEGNTANEIQTYGLNTIGANNALIWINIDNTIGDGATVNNAFAIGFYTMATNSMNGNNIGEAPQLTCTNGVTNGCTTYAQYDDGANVFTILYQGFPGSSTPSGWTQSGSIAINNGITMPTGSQISPYIVTTATYGLTVNQGLDALGNSQGTPDGAASVFMGYWNTAFSAVAGYFINGAVGATPDWVQTGGGSSTEGTLRPAINTYHVFTIYWPSSSSAIFSYDYGSSETLTTHIPTVAAPVGIGYGYGADTNPNPQTMQWMRIRYYGIDGSPTITNSIKQVLSSPSVPSGIVHTVNVSLNNVQTSAITAGTPIAITLNGLEYSPYLNGQLTNFEIYNDITGNILYSWLEIGNSNTLSNGILWIKLPSQIPASTNAVNVITIGMGSITSTFINGNNTGINPVLTTPYAKYDDGANVFTNYQNFVCSSGGPCSIPSGWYTSNSGKGNTIGLSNSVTINNGFTINTFSSDANSLLGSNWVITTNVVEGWFTQAQTTAASAEAQAQLMTSSSTSTSYTLAGNSVGYYDGVSNTFVFEYPASQSTAPTKLGNAIGTNIIGISSSGGGGNVISVYGVNVLGGGQLPYAHEANTVQSANVFQPGYLVMRAQTLKTGTTQKVSFIGNWIRLRIPPPNGVMPVATYGAVQTIPPLTAMISASNTPNIDAGQIEVFTASASGGIGSYTYNFQVFNSITNTLITSHLSSSSKFVWIVPSSSAGNTILANVFVTDSQKSTLVNSINLGQTITINPTLNIPTMSASNTPTIVIGQYEVFTATVVGGTSPYTYNFQVFNSITNTILANQLYTGISSTTNTFVWQIPTADEGNTIGANVYITDSAATQVTENSVNTIITYVSGLWRVPQGVVKTFNITITPGDGNNIYQYNTIPLTFDAGAQFEPYGNNAMTNWVIYNGYTGNILYSWLLGNTSNSFQTYGLNTVNTLLIFTKPDFNVSTAGVTNAMAIGFYSMATNSLNGNNIGESPVLNCPHAEFETAPTDCGYGEYDNGANVFLIYSNFSNKNSGLPNGWTAINSIDVVTNTLSVANSLTLSQTCSGLAWCSAAIYGPSYSTSANVILDSLVTLSFGSSIQTSGIQISNATTESGSDPQTLPGANIGYSISGNLCGDNCVALGPGIFGNGAGTQVVFNTTDNGVLAGIYEVSTLSNGDDYARVNTIFANTLVAAPSITPLYPTIQSASVGGALPGSETAYWIALRPYLYQNPLIGLGPAQNS